MEIKRARAEAFRYFMIGAFPCLFLVLGFVLPNSSETQWEIAGVAVVAAAAISISISLLICKVYLGGIDGSISERLASVTRTALMQADGVWQVWTPDQLSEKEREMEVSTIWIIGRNIASDITDQSPFLDVVKYNMQERKVIYVYIVPKEDPRVKHQLSVLSDALEEFETKEQCFRTEGVELDVWERMPYTAGNVTIYDPSSGHVSSMGYFWYPGGDGEQFGRLGGDVIENWVSHIEALCPGLQNSGTGISVADFLAKPNRGGERAAADGVVNGTA